MFRRYKVHFVRPTPAHGRGRAERDVNVEILKKFVAANGLMGELDRVLPSAAFGILEISCKPLLAGGLSDMTEVKVALKACPDGAIPRDRQYRRRRCRPGAEPATVL